MLAGRAGAVLFAVLLLGAPTRENDPNGAHRRGDRAWAGRPRAASRRDTALPRQRPSPATEHLRPSSPAARCANLLRVLLVMRRMRVPGAFSASRCRGMTWLYDPLRRYPPTL